MNDREAANRYAQSKVELPKILSQLQDAPQAVINIALEQARSFHTHITDAFLAGIAHERKSPRKTSEEKCPTRGGGIFTTPDGEMHPAPPSETL